MSDIVWKSAMQIMSDTTYRELQAIQNECRSVLAHDIFDFARQTHEIIPDWRKPAMMRELGNTFARKIAAFSARMSKEDCVRTSTLIISTQALNFKRNIIEKNIPESILELYPKAFKLLASRLAQPADDYKFPNEYFLKDLRMTLGIGVPGGASIIEIRSRPGNRCLPYIAYTSPYSLLRTRGKLPIARLYIDTRSLEEFNEVGMYKYFQRLSDLMKAYPDLYGFTCKSWFLDPALAQISPHLGFLIRIPVENGAKLLAGPTSSKDVERAIKTSRTRRRMYHEGVYAPKPYTIIWKRNDILAWAARA